MAQNDAVKFVFIPIGEPIPEQKEEGTIYFCAEGQKLYVGDNLIANAGGGGSGDIDIEINGEGDYIASAGFSNNVLTLTKSSLYDAVDNAGFASEGYVNDAIVSATSDFVTTNTLESNYMDGNAVMGAISSAVSHLFIQNGKSISTGNYLYNVLGDSINSLTLGLVFHSYGSVVSGDEDLVTGGIVYSAIQNATSEIPSNFIRHNVDLPSGGYDYLVGVDKDSTTFSCISFYGASYGSIASNDAHAVTGSTVYNYVTSVASGLLSKTHVSMNPEDDKYSNKFLYYADGGSTDTVVNLYYAEFGSVSDSNPYPVTGGEVYSAISSFITGIDIDLAEGSNNGKYLCELEGDSNGTTIRGLYRNFGTVTYGDANLVTGSAVYSGIRDALADAASFQRITSRTIGDTFLYDMHIPSNAADSYILYEAHVGQVTSSEQFFVPGSAIYSAISGLTSKGYVDDAISSIYSMLDSDYATIPYVNSAISNAISNVDSSIGDAINYLIGDSSPLLEESGIMNSVISSFNLASESYVQSYTQDYLSSIITYDHSWDYVNIERDNNTLVYTFNPATFGPIASDARHAVAGSTIYSAIAAIPTIPSYSATDEGKVLKIVNGEPAWVSI